MSAWPSWWAKVACSPGPTPATSPGSTSALYGLAQNEISARQFGTETLRSSVSQLQNLQLEEKSAQKDSTPLEEVKAILGFYRTDANNKILRDESGNPLISQEFLDLGFTESNFDTKIVSDRTGPELFRWSERIRIWMSDDTRKNAMPAEVVSAAELLEQAMREYLASREIVQVGLDPAYATSQSILQMAQDEGNTLNKVRPLGRNHTWRRKIITERASSPAA